MTITFEAPGAAHTPTNPSGARTVPVPADPETGRSRALTAAGTLLVVIGIGYAAASLAAGRRLGIGRDEAVYVSQVSGFGPSAFFSAPRARGITWLVAPAAHFTHSTLAIRQYMSVLSGVGLVAAFWPSLRVRGLRGTFTIPLAALLFATLWVARFYGSAVMPNLWVAFGAVASAGFLVRVLQANRTPVGPLLGLGGSVAFVALLRPTDAVALAGACVLLTVVAGRRRGLLVVSVMAVGGLLGVLPWVVEAYDRFGSVPGRLQAGAATEGGLAFTPSLLSLRVMDGPLLCRPCQGDRPIPLDVGLLWAAAAALVTLALLIGARRRDLLPVALPALAALAMATPYVVGLDYAAPRFLLPAYALTLIPLARGLTLLPDMVSSRARVPLAVAAVLAFGLFAVDQQGLLNHTTARQATKRAMPVAIADELRAQGLAPPCQVSGVDAPLIGYALGCQSSALSGHDRSTTREQLVASQAATGQVVLVRGLTASPEPAPWMAGLWRPAVRMPRPPDRNSDLLVFVPSTVGAPTTPGTGPTLRGAPEVEHAAILTSPPVPAMTVGPGGGA